MAENFDLTKVKLDPKNPHLHAVDCPCSFCQETLEAMDKAAQRFLTEAQQTEQKKKHKKRRAE